MDNTISRRWETGIENQTRKNSFQRIFKTASGDVADTESRSEWEDMENTRCSLRQGGIVRGTDENEVGEGNANIAKRPSSPFKLDVADTNRNGTQRDKSEHRQGCGVEQGSEDVANAKSRESGEQESRNRREGIGRRSEKVIDVANPNGLRPQEHEICKSAIFEQSSQELRGDRQLESGLGGMVDGFSYWLHEPDGIPRVATGIKNRVDRLKCLGNAVVPQQVYPILQAIADIERRAVCGEEENEVYRFLLWNRRFQVRHGNGRAYLHGTL